ncbi:MAG: hypothetical protein KDE28_05515, partial [Anaerolineales bacterium]|nr:hypothetical protein [Anaerolineales bacterium]
RLWISENVIQPNTAIPEQVQSRVKLDRFTGGSFPGALFDQQAQWGGQFGLELTVRRQTARDELAQAHVGLLLLLLKDLWTGDLPLGGEASVGRGRLAGLSATLQWGGTQWEIAPTRTGITITPDPARLQAAVDAIRSWTPGGAQDE